MKGADVREFMEASFLSIFTYHCTFAFVMCKETDKFLKIVLMRTQIQTEANISTSNQIKSYQIISISIQINSHDCISIQMETLISNLFHIYTPVGLAHFFMP